MTTSKTRQRRAEVMLLQHNEQSVMNMLVNVYNKALFPLFVEVVNDVMNNQGYYKEVCNKDPINDGKISLTALWNVIVERELLSKDYNTVPLVRALFFAACFEMEEESGKAQFFVNLSKNPKEIAVVCDNNQIFSALPIEILYNLLEIEDNLYLSTLQDVCLMTTGGLQALLKTLKEEQPGDKHLKEAAVAELYRRQGNPSTNFNTN
jgi:hypothetical protein